MPATGGSGGSRWRTVRSLLGVEAARCVRHGKPECDPPCPAPCHAGTLRPIGRSCGPGLPCPIRGGVLYIATLPARPTTRGDSRLMDRADQKLSFQDLILRLHGFWSRQGCVILQPYDVEMGAGTFHPATTLRALGPTPWRAAYVQPSRRPTDGRYGDNPNRLQHYYQLQVILKPAPADSQNLYLQSLAAIGIDASRHDIRFVEDDWESPTLGAWGLGWEVWLDGMEVSQFTYFQQVGGIECDPVSTELTYGLERLALYVESVKSVFDLDYNGVPGAGQVTYGDVFQRAEREFSTYNFEIADTATLVRHFADAEAECRAVLEHGLALPAYDQCLKASHLFNLLDARGAISVTERAAYILRVRALAKRCCETWLAGRNS